MKVLDLFSGIGGFSLGLERAGMETVAFCEIEPFCREVLKKHWPDVPVHQDIRELNGEEYKGKVDVVCGGFPCQPFSVAGKKKGTEDNRDLWPEMFRVIQQAQPTWVIGENVANFTNMAFTRTKADLESEGYTVQPFIIPACALGAWHRRDRVWIVARKDSATNTSSIGLEGQKFGCSTKRLTGSFEDCIRDQWENEPRVARMVHGVSKGVDSFIWKNRIQSLGNSIVPQMAEIIGGGAIQAERLVKKEQVDGL